MRVAVKLLSVLIIAASFLTIDVAGVVLHSPSVAVAQEERRNFFQRLFGIGRSERRQQRLQQERLRRANESERQRSTAEQSRREAERRANQTLPKIADANRVLVLGDVTAQFISDGLVRAYRRTPSVLISPRVTPDVAITGDTFYDWLDRSDFTFVGERVRAVVVSLGMNDRSAIEWNGRPVRFGSEDWRRSYQRRLVDVAAQLQLMGVPIIWVLPPPVLDNVNTGLARQIGDIQRQTLSPFGFRVVDVSDGFTNEAGSYRQSGLSLQGSRVLLRLNDGIGFTNQGREKLAHYVRQEIDAILDETVGRDLLAARPSSDPQQQVLILTRPALRPGATLAGASGRVSAFYRDERARDFFVSGKALKPPPGRVDFFARPDLLQEEDDGRGDRLSNAVLPLSDGDPAQVTTE